ncbi:hypothetical protein PFISCL1PPCAC_522 [Pristionchus fissidentatus]|uniref:Uncharacterized protein n=1 Tax=Pristionchus fissidentatus TaxID=1538716 RepID=A0AAV5UUM5_9BILA|nr:hypothetical protein PFISCL1PPCAC_522 [Pristionchus fissidentatus]
MTSPRRGRKREPEMNLSELLRALEDDVIKRRRARSEPPGECRKVADCSGVAHVDVSMEADAAEADSAEITWSAQSSKRRKRNKKKMGDEISATSSHSQPKEEPNKEITVIVEEEQPSIYLTPPKSPDHEASSFFPSSDAKQALMRTVNEYRAQGDNSQAITIMSLLGQMAYCYNMKERPGEVDYDNVEQLVKFYTEAPQCREPDDAADNPMWFLPQKKYLMSREVREKVYGAVKHMRSQQAYSTPVIHDHYKSNPMIMAMIKEATQLARNCHTLSLLLEDLQSIPDL